LINNPPFYKPFNGDYSMKFLKTFLALAIALLFINVSAYATDSGGGIITGIASERTANFSTIHNGSKEWKSTGMSFGAAGQQAGGGFIGVSICRFPASAILDVSGSSYSQSYRNRHVNWEGTQTEYLGSDVGASTAVFSSKQGLVMGGFTAGGKAATLSVQGFSDPSGATIAIAGAQGKYSGAAGLGSNYAGAAHGYSYTETVKGIGGLNGSYSEAGMSVSGQMMSRSREPL
jgi:hypothetical protein